MTQKEIKQTCDIAYQMIKDAENILVDMRKLCKHPNTFEGNYSYRVGSIQPAIICSDCGHVIKVHFGNEINVAENENQSYLPEIE
jgi:hypothetical protein